MEAATDLAMALDPTLMMQRSGMMPDAWQRELLRSQAPRILMNCCRQSGKSLIAAIYALYLAMYEDGTLTLLLSPSLRQSQELFRKVADLYVAVGQPVPATAESTLRLELKNGSRIVSLPGKEQTVRGYSGVNLLVLDEAARVEDALYYAVRPMLAVSGGRLVMLTTPFGKRGAFFEAYTGSDPSWHRVMITAHDCPRITPEFLEEEKRSMPDLWFRSEYMCEFVELTDQVFTHDQVQSAITDDVKPLFGEVSVGV